MSESVEENVLEMFFKDREVNGDFVSKVSDMLWQREVLKVVDTNASEPAGTAEQSEQVRIYYSLLSIADMILVKHVGMPHAIIVNLRLP